MTRLSLRTVCLVVAAGVACSSSIVTVCTLLGCIGNLTIAFDAPPTLPYHIEALSVTQGTRTFDCTDPTKCTTASLGDFTPDKLVITITTSNGSRSYNLTPDYQKTYANGPNCGVTCRSATLRLALP